MKTLYQALIWTSLCLPLQAQDVEVIRQDKIFKGIGGESLKAYVFYTPGTTEKAKNPAIALFHGGGWVFGKADEFFTTCERYARMGFITISFEYRLSVNPDGSYPRPGVSPIESTKDARSAIRWLRENAASLKIDPAKIVVGGQSAGGQLALATALLDDVNESTDNLAVSPVPNALLLYSGCVNTMEAWIDNLLGDRREQIWSISPTHNLKKGMPPVIAFHGTEDNQVLPYTVYFFSDKMKALGNSYELITYPGRKHYLGEGNEKYSRYFDDEILGRTDTFLKKLGFMPE